MATLIGRLSFLLGCPDPKEVLEGRSRNALPTPDVVGVLFRISPTGGKPQVAYPSTQ